MSDEQHREDTKYLQRSDGMYVMLEDLECDYEKALIEDSLRDSVYARESSHFTFQGSEDCLGVDIENAGAWWHEDLKIKLTRAQALYIATGNTSA